MSDADVPATTRGPASSDVVPPASAQGRGPRITIGLRLGFDVVVLILMVLATIEANGFRGLARPMPFYIGAIGAVVAALNLALDLYRWRTSGRIIGGQELATALLKEDDRGITDELRTGALAAVWYGGFIMLVWLIGARIAAVIFIFAFGRWMARMSWVGAVVAGLIAGGALWLFGSVMDLQWPAPAIDVWRNGT